MSYFNNKLFIVAALLLTIIIASVGSAQQAPPSPTVRPAGETITAKTPLGDLIGLTNHYDGYKFLGVRFAAPPVGKNRFQDAQPIEAWNEPQNATFEKAGCEQYCKGGKMVKLMCPSTFSEDCLFMNIFTPTLNPSAKLPVMVFIHGGMYSWGSSQIPLYDGSEWGATNNMIVVTINYRLNSFTNMASHHMRGNYGTTDQIQALKFVNQIIGSLGGDPNRVTVSGQSSGACSVGVLMVAPSAWPYFHSAVFLSDPIGFTLASPRMAIELGELMIAKLGCPFGKDANATEQLDCLQAKPAEDILKVSKSTYLPAPDEVLSAIPYVDGVLIPGDPIQQFQLGKFNKVPVYFSNVANETAIFVNSLKVNASTTILDLALDYIFGFADGAKIASLYGDIPPRYPGGGLMYFSRILTDYTFYCPIVHVADIVSSHGLSVSFAFYDVVAPWTKFYVNKSGADQCDEDEVCHAFDLVNYFYNPFILSKLPNGFPQLQPETVKLAHFMQSSVGSFVNYGSVRTSGFPSYNSTTRSMYNYSTPLPTARMNNYRSNFCDFWIKLGWNRH